MAIICPAVLAENEHAYRTQMERVIPFASRIQIDLADGIFTSIKNIPIDKVWWPAGIQADLHLMDANPQRHLEIILKLKPNLVIVHGEAAKKDDDFNNFFDRLHEAGIKTGLAFLPQTDFWEVIEMFDHIDHVLIFSGNLGHFGGVANLSLESKIKEIRKIELSFADKTLEIGWDGGITDQNIRQISDFGVDVLNVGGFIQRAADPAAAYAALVAKLADTTV